MDWFSILGSLLTGGIVGLLLGFIIDACTVEDTVRDEVRSHSRFKDAFKAMIKSKTTRSVNVGIFGNNDNHLGDIELESDKGVAADVKVGHVFYLNN